MLGLSGDDTHHIEIRELLKKATALANTKDYEAAIKCLLRAYELMASCSTEWGIKAYFRAARYYHLAGRYDDARAWLQQLHDNVDTTADAREVLYKKWGWRQKGSFAKISKTIRNNYRELIWAEINLLNARQAKITAKERRRADSERQRQSAGNGTNPNN